MTVPVLSAVYALQQMAGGTLRVCLFDTTKYAFNAGTHQWLSDIPSAARISISDPLSNVVIGPSGTGGAQVDADDAVCHNVTSSATLVGAAVYSAQSTEGTSRLLDVKTVDASGSPISFVFNGTDVTVQWSTVILKVGS